MKLLFDFLIEKKIVTQEQALLALFEQHRSQPTIAEICFKNKLIPTEKIIEIIKNQKNSIDFVTSAQKIGIWTDDMNATVFQILSNSKKPYLEIISQFAGLNTEKIETIISEYFSEIKESLGSESKQPQVVAEANNNLKIPTADKEAIADNSQYDIALLNEMFIEEKKKMFIEAIEMKGTESEKEILCQNCLKEIQILKGVCTLNNLSVHIAFLINLEKMMSFIIQNKSNNLDIEKQFHLMQIGSDAINILWEDVSGIISGKASQIDLNASNRIEVSLSDFLVKG